MASPAGRPALAAPAWPAGQIRSGRAPAPPRPAALGTGRGASSRKCVAPALAATAAAGISRRRGREPRRPQTPRVAAPRGAARSAARGAGRGAGGGVARARSGGSGEAAAASAELAQPAWPLPPQQLRALGIVLLCFLVTVICALDRAAMSVTIIPMSAQFAYSDGVKGVIAAAYFWGYTLSNLASGVLCTRVSPKLILAAGAVLWSAFTVLTPAAAGASLPWLLGCRALMGAAEGACLPTIQQLLANWVPRAERSKALALVTSGITAGTVGALYGAPLIVGALGWPSVFLLFGATGFVWCAAWVPTAEDAPRGGEECAPYACELSWDTAEGVAESWGSIRWGRLAGSTAFRGVVVCGMAHNIGQLLILSWLPTYFAQSFGLGVAEASMLAVPPWVACFAVGNAAGWAADALGARGAALADVRRGFQLLGSLGPAACLLALAAGPQGEQPAVLLFTFALGLSACSYAGFNAAPQDMARRTASLVYGLLNAAGCLAGSLAVWLTGVALEAAPGEQGFAPVFLAAAGAYAVGAAAFLVSYRGEREFD